jgi:hypothetical protein
VDWILITYRLPSEPSRHRVAVWRELRRVGALALQQATWALPARADFLEALSRVIGHVEAAGGDVLVFDATPRGDDMEAGLEDLFTAERQSEWTEFCSECDKFDAEIAKEIRIGKFTAAELDEEEHSLDRLRRWFRDLRRRDVFVAPMQAEAELRLKRCDEALEEYAQRVYAHGGER